MVNALVVSVVILTVVAGVVFFWTLRKSAGPGDEDAGDLTEWECPECGFRVQMGTACIYCGAQKPAD